jgi:hypothetical protein
VNYGGKIVDDMAALVALFAPHCKDHHTLNELEVMIRNRGTWSKAHDLFDRIRRKTLVAERNHDGLLF